MLHLLPIFIDLLGWNLCYSIKYDVFLRYPSSFLGNFSFVANALWILSQRHLQSSSVHCFHLWRFNQLIRDSSHTRSHTMYCIFPQRKCNISNWLCRCWKASGACQPGNTLLVLDHSNLSPQLDVFQIFYITRHVFSLRSRYNTVSGSGVQCNDLIYVHITEWSPNVPN